MLYWEFGSSLIQDKELKCPSCCHLNNLVSANKFWLGTLAQGS